MLVSIANTTKMDLEDTLMMKRIGLELNSLSLRLNEKANVHAKIELTSLVH